MVFYNSIIKYCCFIWFLIQFVHSLDESLESTELVLDDKMKKLAFSLIKSSADKSFLQKISDDYSFLLDPPKESIAMIYINYTQRQIQALKNELNLHDHYIYEPIKMKTKEIEQNFSQSCEQFWLNDNLVRLEKDFLTTGEQLVGLQKLILRIINSKLEERINMKNLQHYHHHHLEVLTQRNDGGVLDEFDYLARLFFGFPATSSFYKFSSFIPVNQLFTLLEKLRTATTIGSYYHSSSSSSLPNNDDNKPNISENSINDKSFNQLSSLLYRLRYIYYLYRIASYSNQVLNTLYLKPYAYQATIKLVDLLGYMKFSNPLVNPLLSQFRFWMNLLNGNIQLNILSRPSVINKQTKYDPKMVNDLIKILRDNEQRQRQQIEQQRLKMMLENLMKSQNKQQEQIDTILRLLTNRTKQTSANESNQINKPIETPNSNPINDHHQYSTTTQRTPLNTIQGDTLNQLKKQRKLLNELLQELQKPFKNNTNENPPLPSRDSINRNKTELNQAQNSLLNIMKNITPLINAMAQSNLVSRPKLEKSKFDLLTIVNSASQREFLDGDDSSFFGVIERLANKLKNVLDDIIVEVTGYEI